MGGTGRLRGNNPAVGANERGGRLSTVDFGVEAGAVMPQPHSGQEHLRRVRRICGALPETVEKLSHGEPTFFVRKRVFTMFANNHHQDGHIAVWIPAAAGVQEALTHSSPQKYFRPPYVGVKGWLGIELERVSDEELAAHVLDAWRLVAPKGLALKRGGLS